MCVTVQVNNVAADVAWVNIWSSCCRVFLSLICWVLVLMFQQKPTCVFGIYYPTCSSISSWANTPPPPDLWPPHSHFLPLCIKLNLDSNPVSAHIVNPQVQICSKWLSFLLHSCLLIPDAFIDRWTDHCFESNTLTSLSWSWSCSGHKHECMTICMCVWTCVSVIYGQCVWTDHMTPHVCVCYFYQKRVSHTHTHTYLQTTPKLNRKFYIRKVNFI